MGLLSRVLSKIREPHFWARKLDVGHPNVLRLERRHEFRRLMLPPAGFDVSRNPTDDEVAAAIKAVPIHRRETLFGIYNSSLATTAAPVSQPTGNTIRTMLLLRAGVGQYLGIAEWGISFDASAAATPGKVELFETTVSATMSTAFVNADVQRFSDSNAGAQGDTTNLPLDVTSTSTSGFATAAVTEGTVANYRMADLQLLPPTAPYIKQFPLGREFQIKAQNYLRCRVTFGATVNAYIYVVFVS